MSINKELLKSGMLMLIPMGMVIYWSLNFLTTCKGKLFSISLIILLGIIYFLLLEKDLKQIKNEYDRDMSEHKKKWQKEIEDTQKDLEARGMTFSGEAIKKLGGLGEIRKNQKDHEEYQKKKFKLKFTKAKYLVLISLLKIKN